MSQYSSSCAAAWAAESFEAVLPLARRAWQAAYSGDTLACVDTTVPPAACGGAGADYAPPPPMVLVGGDKKRKWLVPVLVTVTVLAGTM